jgi:hypothetical protein
MDDNPYLSPQGPAGMAATKRHSWLGIASFAGYRSRPGGAGAQKLIFARKAKSAT